MIKTFHPKIVNKKWGHEKWITDDGGTETGYCGKILVYHPGPQSSFHYHPRKHETMYVVSGVGVVETLPPNVSIEEWTPETELVKETLTAGMTLVFPPNTPHRLRASLETLTIFEVSTPHDDNDVVRLIESCGM